MIPYRKCLDQIPEYIPGVRIKGLVKLSSNENLGGASPLAKKAYKKALKDIHYYPDGNCIALRRKLALQNNLAENQIIIGNGSDEVFHFACAAFMEKDCNAVIADPTFSEYAFSTMLFEGSLIKVPLNEGNWNLQSVSDCITEKTRIVFLCNPNNPTGTFFTETELRAFLDRTGKNILVILDEAYCHFADDGQFPKSLDLLSTYPNLLVSRTFSKAYGLAGLRIGWAAADEKIISLMLKTKGPFNINIPAQEAALAALEDIKFLAKTIERNRSAKLFMYEQLKQLGLTYYPTQANFICIKVPMEAKQFASKVMEYGLTIRPLTSFGLNDWIRVTLSKASHNRKLIEAFRRVLV